MTRHSERRQHGCQNGCGEKKMLVSMPNVTLGVQSGQQILGAGTVSHLSIHQECVPTSRHRRGSGEPTPKQTNPAGTEYNNNDGRCTFGEKCKYQHKCQNCEGGHPLSRCPKLRRDHSNGNGRGSKTS